MGTFPVLEHAGVPMLSSAIVCSVLAVACWCALRVMDYEGATLRRKGLPELSDVKGRILATTIGLWLFSAIAIVMWVRTFGEWIS